MGTQVMYCNELFSQFEACLNACKGNVMYCNEFFSHFEACFNACKRNLIDVFETTKYVSI